MNKKKILIKPKHIGKDLDAKIDDWINLSQPISTTINQTDDNINLKNEFFRTTIDIPLYLHRRIKKYCAVSGISMKNKIIQVLEEKFPET